MTDSIPEEPHTHTNKEQIIQRSNLLSFYLNPPTDLETYKAYALSAHREDLKGIDKETLQQLITLSSAATTYGVLFGIFDTTKTPIESIKGLAHSILIIGTKLTNFEEIETILPDLTNALKDQFKHFFFTTSEQSKRSNKKIDVIQQWIRATLWLGSLYREEEPDLGAFKDFIQNELDLDGL